MLYGLQPIEDHPCFKMQELFEGLFFDYVRGEDFNTNIFPSNFSYAYLNHHGKQFDQSLRDLRSKLPKRKAKMRRLYSQFINNNSVEALCNDPTFTPSKNIDWDKGFGKVLSDFMINCYETKLDLKPFNRAGCRLKPTNRFYKDFVDKNDHICPFCGLNNYKNKFGKNREDLDHYLYKAEYPLAAANMWNLIPTCGECNQVYKKTLDVLFKESSRTRAYYPYERVHGVKVWIDLDTAKDKSKPEAWRVTFTPNEDTELDKVENWLRIYGIEERYRNDLACYFDKWIMDALLERESKFKNNRDFQKFMFSRAKKERQRYKKKLEPKAFLKCSFFVFVARRADNAFIGRYLYIFNADYK